MFTLMEDNEVTSLEAWERNMLVDQRRSEKRLSKGDFRTQEEIDRDERGEPKRYTPVSVNRIPLTAPVWR